MRLFVNWRACAIQGERPLPNGSVPYYLAALLERQVRRSQTTG